MKLLRRIFGRPEPKRIVDPAFGELFFVRDAWLGSFSPLAEAELTVHAGESGPTPRQRGLFMELRRRFDALQPAIEERLAKEYLIRREVDKAAHEESGPGRAGPFDLDFSKRPVNRSAAGRLSGMAFARGGPPVASPPRRAVG